MQCENRLFLSFCGFVFCRRHGGQHAFLHFQDETFFVFYNI
ncbi:hypothetical protein HDR66_03220 [bacterium]|nr:hypothetical protein [bacterium]